MYAWRPVETLLGRIYEMNKSCRWYLNILNNSLQELSSGFESSNTLEDDRINNKLMVFIYQSTSCYVWSSYTIIKNVVSFLISILNLSKNQPHVDSLLQLPFRYYLPETTSLKSCCFFSSFLLISSLIEARKYVIFFGWLLKNWTDYSNYLIT